MIIASIFLIIFLFIMNLPLYHFIQQGNIIPLAKNIPFFLITFSGAFISYIISIYFLRKKNQLLIQADKISHLIHKKKVLLILLLALLMRLPFLIADPIPSLSDDIFRYWWDGQVQIEGINPYHYSPEEFPYDKYKVDYYQQINHPKIPTVYPPFLELIFYIFYSIHPSLLSIKIAFMLFDLLSIVVILLLLSKRKLSANRVIIYAWNPLVIVEFYHSGHNDSLVVLLLVLVIYLYHSSKREWSIITLALLTLTKYIGLLFLPFYYRKIHWKYFIYYFIIILLAYIYYYDSNMFTALINYGQYWKYNSSLYQLLSHLFNHEQVPKFILGIVSIGIYLFQWWKNQQGNEEWERPIFIIVGILLLISPVLHPWYVTHIIPLLTIYFYRSWILFTGLIALSYITLIDYYQLGIWHENIYVLMLEYIPFYALMIYDFVKVKNRC